ncbi:MAG: hypothetical protein SGJ09_04280 [Phycisphaerae bacterium]|nr:hypothetical protein [Phycisphaerae bacterium]
MNATTTTSTGTTKTTTTNATSQPNNAAAQACCQGANDAFKTGVDASQTMFNTFKNMFNVFNMDAFTAPFTATASTMPATFEKMTKAMNTLVDANARFVTECSTLTVDAMRTNARMLERTGDMMVSSMAGKNSKPVTETSREIFDEACAFTTKTGERVMKMNTEHGQTISQNWVQLADTFVSQNGAAKSCCNG